MVEGDESVNSVEELLEKYPPKSLGRIEQEEKEKLRKLKEKSKPLSELVFTEYFKVNDVLGENFSVIHDSGIVGNYSSGYETGYISKLTLSVTPSTDIPVRKLSFQGNADVKAGDFISVKIPRYKIKEIEDKRIMMDIPEKLYFDRDWKGKESAIEIKIFESDGGRFLRTDRAVDYHKFMRD